MEHNNIYRSVFKVTHSGGSGSCFYLKNYDLFVTNYHVVEGYRTVAVHDNDRNPYLGKVVLVNPTLDIALLAVDGDFSSLPELQLASDESLAIGGKVYVAGYPYGMPFTVTEGSVSSPKQLVSGNSYVNGTIEDMKIEDYAQQVTTADGRIVTAVDPDKKDIVFTIKTTVPKGTATPSIGTQEVRAGRTFIVKTNDFETSGNIDSVDIAE